MANEADTAERFVREVVERCRKYPFRAIHFVAVLDRASTDGTLDLLRKQVASLAELRVVYAPENRGVVDAYMRGYREALALGADWVLEMDAGYSHQPADIPKFLDGLAPHEDAVFATRFARGSHYAGGIGRRFLVSWLGSWVARVLLGVRLSDATSGFQLFSAAALERVVDRGLQSRGPFFQTEIKYRLRDCRVREVPIHYIPTAQAVRPAALGDALRVVLRLLRERLASPLTP
ncbi:MAG TPA: glycosyltransferase [Verrucomicrobiae bacterium]|nr:glycosyltransferase [Verrucomicrobiae bacterium]